MNATGTAVQGSAHSGNDEMAVPLGRRPVRVSVFGGLRIWRDGQSVAIGPRRQQLVLAMLVVAAGHVVSISELVDVVWGQAPPASAVNQVHRLVGQLRRALEPGLSLHLGGRFIGADGVGYRLAAEMIDCDLFQYRESCAGAEVALRTGDVVAASGHYADALELARGPIFGVIDPATVDRPEFVALEQERVSVTLAAADIALKYGSSPRIMAAVTRAAAASPLNELLHLRLMQLLVADGRRGDALVVFAQLRRRLADELGIGPGRELDQAHQLMLRQERAETEESDRDAMPAGPSVRPAQLPRPLTGFVARPDAEAALEEGLSAVDGTVMIAAIGGMGGIGKTALAVQWAHRVIDRFPDGQLYVNLRGFDPGGRLVEPAEAINSLLEALGQPLTDLDDADLDARAARYRSLMAGRRMILLLDNARDSAQVRPLLPGAPGSLVLITSRNRLTSLVAHENVRYVPLGRLAPPDARLLLMSRLGAPRIDGDTAAVDGVVTRCAGLPLALSMVAARIATSPELSMTEVVSRLFDAGSPLDALTTGEGRDDVRTVFSWSYRALPHDSARFFRLLAAHPGPQVSLASLASVGNVTAGDARRLARQLVSAHLLEEPVADRFTVHDLLRSYAGELMTSSGERDEAEQRLVEHYLHSTRAAYLIYGRPPIADLAPVSPGVQPETFDSQKQTVQWYVLERAVLASVIELAFDHGWWRQAIILVLDWRPMNQVADSLPGTRALSVRASRAAADLGEFRLEAELERDIGFRSLDDNAAADAHYRRALALYDEIGDTAGQSHTYRNLATAADGHGDHQLSSQYARLSVEFARRSGRDDVLGLALHQYAMCALRFGRYRESADSASEAMRVLGGSGISYFHDDLFQLLAEAYLGLDMTAEALAAAERGLEFNDSIQGHRWVSVGLAAVAAEAAFRCGIFGRAREACGLFDRVMVENDEQHRRSADAQLYRNRIALVRAGLAGSV